MKNYIQTSEKIEVYNYPYGFKLKTTLTDFIEFDYKKGYRHCTQTVDPKNGRINKPKKSTYSQLIVRYYDDNGHIKTLHFDFNGKESINKGCFFIYENFNLFTTKEIEYLYTTILGMSLVDCKATCIYGGSKPEELKPFYLDFWANCKKGLKEGINLFDLLILDIKGIDTTRPENYNPFKVTSYEILG